MTNKQFKRERERFNSSRNILPPSKKKKLGDLHFAIIKKDYWSKTKIHFSLFHTI